MPSSNSRPLGRKYYSPAKNFVHIPYPNELEIPFHTKKTGKPLLDFSGLSGFSSFSGIIEFIRARITIEEIILVGIIIVLVNEEIRDEFLLIMLVYILIF